MKNVKLVLVLVVTGIVATACCCPLELCLGGVPQGALPSSDRPLSQGNDQLAPIAAAAPVVHQRF